MAILDEYTYKPNPFEKKLIEENPVYSKISIDSAYLAQSIMTFLYLHPFHQHNNGDAFRHCLWSSIMAKETTSEWALRWGTAHEEIFAKDNLSRIMDESNNSKGVLLIKESKPYAISDLIFRCSQLIHQGQLLKISNGQLVTTESSGFNIPNVFYVISEKANDVLSFIADYYSEKTLELDQEGNTALHRCIFEDNKQGFDILIKVLDVNTAGNSGLTPLMICSTLSYGHKYGIELIAKGADPIKANKLNGETALMLAAVYNNKEMVDLLLPISNKNAKSLDGFTAYDFAVNENHLAIAKLLI